MGAIALLLFCAILIYIVWRSEHPVIIDRGEGVRKKWDRHSIWHLLVPMALAGLCLWMQAHPIVAFLVAGVVIPNLWELAQWKPHDKGPGYYETWDAIWGLVGAGVISLGALVT